MNCVVVQNSGIARHVVDHLFRKYPHSMTTIAMPLLGICGHIEKFAETKHLGQLRQME